MTAALVRAWRGVRWYLREFTGEAELGPLPGALRGSTGTRR